MHVRIDIRVSGTFTRVAGASRPEPMDLVLALDATPSSASGERVFPFAGTLSAQGLASDVPITGNLRFSDWRRPRLEYASTFTGDQGAPHQLRGRRILGIGDLVRPRLALDAEICQPEGTLVARCRLDARWRPAWPF